MDFDKKFIYLKKTITNLEKESRKGQRKKKKGKGKGKEKTKNNKGKRGIKKQMKICMLSHPVRWSSWFEVDL